MDGKDFFLKLADHLHEGVYFLDLQRRITFWNKGAERITGFAAAEVLGRRCADQILIHVNARGESLCGTDRCAAQRSMREGCCCEDGVYLRHKMGYRLPVSVRTLPLCDEKGNITGTAEFFVEQFSRHELIRRISELEKLALLDPLTRIANRRFGESFLGAKLNEFHRHGIGFGILMIDIDNFKAINDRHGHAAGDDVLKMVAATLSANTRSFDCAARLGGDEFLAVIGNVDHLNLRDVAEKLRLLIVASSLGMSGAKVAVTVSIGGTTCQPQDSMEVILKRADDMLLACKTAGKNKISLAV